MRNQKRPQPSTSFLSTVRNNLAKRERGGPSPSTAPAPTLAAFGSINNLKVAAPHACAQLLFDVQGAVCTGVSNHQQQFYEFATSLVRSRNNSTGGGKSPMESSGKSNSSKGNKSTSNNNATSTATSSGSVELEPGVVWHAYATKFPLRRCDQLIAGNVPKVWREYSNISDSGELPLKQSVGEWTRKEFEAGQLRTFQHLLRTAIENNVLFASLNSGLSIAAPENMARIGKVIAALSQQQAEQTSEAEQVMRCAGIQEADLLQACKLINGNIKYCKDKKLSTVWSNECIIPFADAAVQLDSPKCALEVIKLLQDTKSLNLAVATLEKLSNSDRSGRHRNLLSSLEGKWFALRSLLLITQSTFVRPKSLVPIVEALLEDIETARDEAIEKEEAAAAAAAEASSSPEHSSNNGVGKQPRSIAKDADSVVAFGIAIFYGVGDYQKVIQVCRQHPITTPIPQRLLAQAYLNTDDIPSSLQVVKQIRSRWNYAPPDIKLLLTQLGRRIGAELTVGSPDTKDDDAFLLNVAPLAPTSQSTAAKTAVSASSATSSQQQAKEAATPPHLCSPDYLSPTFGKLYLKVTSANNPKSALNNLTKPEMEEFSKRTLVLRGIPLQVDPETVVSFLTLFGVPLRMRCVKPNNTNTNLDRSSGGGTPVKNRVYKVFVEYSVAESCELLQQWFNESSTARAQDNGGSHSHNHTGGILSHTYGNGNNRKAIHFFVEPSPGPVANCRPEMDGIVDVKSSSTQMNKREHDGHDYHYAVTKPGSLSVIGPAEVQTGDRDFLDTLSALNNNALMDPFDYEVRTTLLSKAKLTTSSRAAAEAEEAKVKKKANNKARRTSKKKLTPSPTPAVRPMVNALLDDYFAGCMTCSFDGSSPSEALIAGVCDKLSALQQGGSNGAAFDQSRLPTLNENGIVIASRKLVDKVDEDALPKEVDVEAAIQDGLRICSTAVEHTSYLSPDVALQLLDCILKTDIAEASAKAKYLAQAIRLFAPRISSSTPTLLVDYTLFRARHSKTAPFDSTLFNAAAATSLPQETQLATGGDEHHAQLAKELGRLLLNDQGHQSKDHGEGAILPYGTWACSSCGNQISERYNDCTCGTLRDPAWQCSECTFLNVPIGQGNSECVVCEAAKPPAPRILIPMQPWSCASCNSTNLPVISGLLECSSCRKNTGPFKPFANQFSSSSSSSSSSASSSLPEPCGSCGHQNELGPAVRPYCEGCGKLSEQVPEGAASVWHCPSCKGWQPWCDSFCSSCAHVPQVAARTRRGWRPVVCKECQHRNTNPTATSCGSCNADLTAAAAYYQHLSSEEATGADVATAVVGSTSSMWVCQHNERRNEEGEATEEEAAGASSICFQLNSEGRSTCSRCHAPAPSAASKKVYYSAAEIPACASCLQEYPSHTHVTPYCKECNNATVAIEWNEVTVAATARWLSDASVDDPMFLVSVLESWTRASSSSSSATLQPSSSVPSVWRATAKPIALMLLTWRSKLDLATLTGRRGLALCNMMDELIGYGASGGTADAIENNSNRSASSSSNKLRHRCKECLGTHPTEWCVFSPHTHWDCEECGRTNNIVDGLERYLCGSCLQLRPEAKADSNSGIIPDADALLTEAWECPACKRCNLLCEDMCVYCHWISTENVKKLTSDILETLTGEAPPVGEELEAAPQEGEAAAAAATEEAPLSIPFFPAHCGVCCMPHLEALCPICTTQPTPQEVEKGKGIILKVAPNFAFIQPHGTVRSDQQVYVSRSLFRGSTLVAGQVVQFDAKTGNEGLRATSIVQCDE